MQALRFERSDKSRLALFLVNRGMFKYLWKYLFTSSSATFDHCEIWWSNVLLVCWKEKNVILCLHVYITQTSMAVLWIILAPSAIQPKHLIFLLLLQNWLFIVNFEVTTKLAWLAEILPADLLSTYVVYVITKLFL